MIEERSMTTARRWRSIMESFLMFVLIIGIYLGLQYYILPKLGVGT